MPDEEQQQSEGEDDQELVMNERRRKCECFNYAVTGYLARVQGV